MSVLAACQKQLQSELLLAETEMHVRTEDGGQGPGGVQVRGTPPCCARAETSLTLLRRGRARYTGQLPSRVLPLVCSDRS